MPTVGLTKLTNDVDATNITAYTTASITPPASSLLVAFTVLRDNTGQPTVPTLTGAATWAQYGSAVNWRTSSEFGTLFAHTGVAPFSTSAVTITAAEAMTGAAWAIFSITGTNNTAAAVAQAKSNIASAAASLTVTFDTTPANGSLILAAFTRDVNEAMAPAAGYTESSDQGQAAPTNRLQTQWRASGAATASATWVTSSEVGGLALEIAARPDNLPLLGVS